MRPRLHLDFEVPGAPVPWKRPEQNARGGRRTNAKDGAHRELVAIHARRASSEQRKEPLAGDVQVMLTFVLPIPASATRRDREAMQAGLKRPRGSDIDNLSKAVFDAVQGIAFLNDSQVSAMFARKLYGIEPKTVVTVYELVPPEAS